MFIFHLSYKNGNDSGCKPSMIANPIIIYFEIIFDELVQYDSHLNPLTVNMFLKYIIGGYFGNYTDKLFGCTIEC